MHTLRYVNHMVQDDAQRRPVMLTGVLVRSAKSTFIVGADITEFTGLFALAEEEVLSWVAKTR